MKKSFIITLLALSSLSMLAYDFEVNGIYYNITSSSALTVEVTYPSRTASSWSSEYYYTCHYYGNVTIPELVTYNNSTYTVTRIGDYAFATSNSSSYDGFFSNLKSITLPNTLQSIGYLAFWSCRALTTVTIPSNVTSIGDAAFAGCNNVKTYFIQSVVPPSCNYGFNISPFGWPPYQNGEIIVPQKKDYIATEEWADYGDRLIEIITIESQEYTYDGKEHTINWVNNMKAYDVEVTGNETIVNAGDSSALIHVKCTKEGNIFADLSFEYEYSITKANLELCIVNSTRQYGEENPKFEYSSVTGFVNNEDISVIDQLPVLTTNATPFSNVGNYSIIPNGGEAKNYIFNSKPGTLTITKAPLSAKVNDNTKTYGSGNPSFSMTFYGLKNNETTPVWETKPSFLTDATKKSGVGQYEVKASGGILTNYELGEVKAGVLYITPASLTIKANNATRKYYEENPDFDYYCTGFVNGDNQDVLSSIPIISTSAIKSSPVGKYLITISETSSPNYSISYVNGTLTITKRTLIASVGNYERQYNEDNPTFEIKYEGFVGDDDEKVLNEKIRTSTNATKTSDVGIYPINISGGSVDNYNISYTSGTLTINKAEQTISWEQDLSNLQVGDQVELKAVASSGLPITYTLDNNNAGDIYTAGTKTYLDCLSSGRFIIRAVQNGNPNYYSSLRANQTVIINENAEDGPTLIIKQADNGSISTIVNKGSCHTFTINVENGWKIHSVTFNDEDVTAQLDEGNRFTTPAIFEISTLSVVYEKTGENAIKAVSSSDVKIQGMSFGARVTGTNHGELIQVYTLDGVLHKSLKADGSVIDIPLANSKGYIIKVGKKTVQLSI